MQLKFLVLENLYKYNLDQQIYTRLCCPGLEVNFVVISTNDAGMIKADFADVAAPGFRVQENMLYTEESSIVRHYTKYSSYSSQLAPP